MTTAAQDVAKALKAWNIRRVFALCADQTNSLLDALSDEGIVVVGTRQESAAVHMADGWARATGEPGVAIVGGGPGFLNAVTGFAVSQSAATPVLVIAGQPALHTRDRNGHQILYQADIVRSLTKWSQEVVSPAIAAEFVCRGIGIATAGKPGPVHISIPVNVMDADAEASVYRIVPGDWRSQSYETVKGDSMSRALALLNAAKRPMMIVGGGAWWELGRGESKRLSEMLGIPIFTTELARGLIADDGASCFGYAHPSFNRTFNAISSADLLIFAGTEMNLHTGAATRGLVGKNTKIVQLHRDPAQIGIGRATDAALLGPLDVSLCGLAGGIEHTARVAHGAWLAEVQQIHAKHQKEWDAIRGRVGRSKSSSVHPLLVCDSMRRHYSDKVRVVIDGGDFVHWPRLYFRAQTPGFWMDGAEIGALGASLPVGIGAQMGRPAAQTWVFIGDGGFGFYGFDLSTAVEHKLSIKVIIGNDGCWGVERRLQLASFKRTVATDIREIEYHNLALAMGAKARMVQDPAELDGAVDEMVASDGPFVLNVRIPRDMGRPLMK